LKMAGDEVRLCFMFGRRFGVHVFGEL